MQSLEAARDYHRRGWAPIPLRPGEKAPLINWRRFQEQPPQLKNVESWWGKHPDAGVAIVTGPASGLLVVDVDPRNGGEQSIRGMHLPPTLVTLTGGGGRHYLYRCSDSLPTRAAALPGVDLLARGHIAVMPPSGHPNGNLYRVAMDAAVAAAPSWALDLLRRTPNQAPTSGSAVERPTVLREGQRNDRLFRAACGFARGGCYSCGNVRCRAATAEHLVKRLEGLNQKWCKPPLPVWEVKVLAENAWTVAQQDRQGGQTTAYCSKSL
jgi:hypothetical protein